MADTKITALTALTAADPANDVIPIVDVSDTSMAASGTTKKISVNNILGASGTATLASATITGAATVGTTLGVTGNLTVDTNVLKVDTTNNRVGINTATPGYPLEVVGNAVFSADATCKRFFINDTTGTANAYINSADGSQSIIYLGGQTNYANGAIIYDDASNFLAFRANGVEAARFNSTRNLVFPTGKGIDFSAVTGGTGTATANVLNDYEEGTFTPTFTASSGTLTTVTSVSANYTKIGRRVSIDIDFFFSNIGTATGVLFLTLPFTRSSANDTCGAFREISATGSMGSIYADVSDATKVSLSFYNNTSIIVNTYRFIGTYTYNV